MAHLILAEETLRWLWGERFKSAKLLNRDDILELTIERGEEIGDLLLYLDEDILPGIFKKVVEKFINSRVKEMLPIQVLSDPELSKILSDSREFFKTKEEDVARGLFIERYINTVNKKSQENVKRAMTAIIEFSLGNLAAALINAAFAVNELEVPNFSFGLDQVTITAMNAIMNAEKEIASIVLDVACEMQAATNT